MEEYLIYLPISIEMNKIISNLKKRDWIVSNFSGNPDLYNPILFIKERALHKKKFIFLLDKNILDYVLSSKRNLNSSEVRDAIGFMAFCQLADIELDISLAIHELIHDELGMERALNDIEKFFQIDDSNRIGLEKYATKKTDKFTINKKVVTKSKQQISNWYNNNNNKIEKNFLNYYLIVLKTTYIFSIKEQQNLDGFIFLIDWMQTEFGCSAIGLAYALNIFRRKKFPKSMKYKQSHTMKKRKNELTNMTWDLYVMYEFIRKLKEKKENSEYCLVSADKFLRAVLKTTIEINSSKSLEEIKKTIVKEDHPLIDYFIKNYKIGKNNRAFNDLSNNEEKIIYRKKLIKGLETKLLS